MLAAHSAHDRGNHVELLGLQDQSWNRPLLLWLFKMFLQRTSQIQ